jgi:general secretion pathway protein L
MRRSLADDWLQRLQQAEGAADVLSWPGAWPGANLLPVERRRHPERAGRLLRLLLGLLLLGLAAAALLLPLLAQRSIAIDLGAQVAQARTQAAKIAALRDQIEQDEKAANFVVEQKRAAPYLVPLLARLTELIPDDTWINQLNYAKGQVDFAGESKQASALIELLARDPAFHNITFRSPIIGVRNADKERFHIQLDYSGIEEAQ